MTINAAPTPDFSADHNTDVLSQERIVSVACRLLESSGLEGVTMRRVAAALGVTPMALYHHVPNKQVLLTLVSDAVIGTTAYPGAETGRWYQRIREGLLAVHREIARFPGLGIYVWGSNNRFFPSGLIKLRSTLKVLAEAGFDEDEALSGLYLLTTYLGGYFLMEEHPHRDHVPPVFSLEGGEVALDPSLHSRRDLSSNETFLRGLDTIIAGLRAQLAAKLVLIATQTDHGGAEQT